MNAPKPFSSLTKFRIVIESFANTQCVKRLLQGYPHLLLDLANRLGDFQVGSVVFEHLKNYNWDPNINVDERCRRTQILIALWKWCGNEGLDQSSAELEKAQSLLPGASDSVLSVEQVRTCLAQAGRPWTIPYLVPRLFLGLEHSVALGFVRGADSTTHDYPVVMERDAEGREQICAPNAALKRWLEPYRRLRNDEPCIQDPRITDYVAHQAAKLNLPWDQWMAARTFAAYRLALTCNVSEVARQTGFPEAFVSLAFSGLISYRDALRYFELTPRACRRHNWDEEVSQWLDWHIGGYMLGASLVESPIL